MVEAIQGQMGNADIFELNPLLLKNDAGAILARRELQKLRGCEGNASSR